jgi:protein-tyrosine-phosphatase
VDLTDAFPKPLTDEVVQAADIVITMGCGDACPVLPGRRYLDWPVTDPEGAPIAVVRSIRDEIDAHITELLASLPSS